MCSVVAIITSPAQCTDVPNADLPLEGKILLDALRVWSIFQLSVIPELRSETYSTRWRKCKLSLQRTW